MYRYLWPGVTVTLPTSGYQNKMFSPRDYLLWKQIPRHFSVMLIHPLTFRSFQQCCIFGVTLTCINQYRYHIIDDQVWYFRYFRFFIFQVDYFQEIFLTQTKKWQASICTAGNRKSNTIFLVCSITACDWSLGGAGVGRSTLSSAEDAGLNQCRWWHTLTFTLQKPLISKNVLLYCRSSKPMTSQCGGERSNHCEPF